MTQDVELPDFGRADALERLLHGAHDPIWRVVTWAFVLAALSHLWLGDAVHPDWWAGNAAMLAGTLLLAWRRVHIGWWLCALGALLPLWFGRDQLTQSMLLLFFSTSAGLGHSYDAWRGGDRGAQATLACWRVFTIATYALAALHKLNAQYLDPTYSCAVYGWDAVLKYWNIGWETPSWMLAWLPHFTLMLEGGIALLHLTGRSRLAWPLTIIFHIPLTVTMAPAFAFVMLAGHAAFVGEEDLRRVREVRWQWIGLAALALTIVSLGLHGSWPEASMMPKEWLLWTLLLGFGAMWPPWRQDAWTRSWRTPAGVARRAAVVGALLYVVHGLTPYLGVQYQHTAAMLSNLRIDRGCWNSSVFPESVRVTEDYIRIERAWLGEPGRHEKTEKTLTMHLWSPPQLRQVRRNWCKPATRPLFLEGTWRQRPFVIEDLCDEASPWPFEGAGFFGVEIFGDYLRFQKNLERTCPQKCIH